MFLRNAPQSSAKSLQDERFPDDALATFFLARLGRLLSLRRTARDQIDASGVRLLDNAIYSTYRDLQSLYREHEARALLAEYREGRPFALTR